ncbi:MULTISPECIES: UDP-glucose 4-epimerase family protein [Ralstonia]|nr:MULTISPECIES: SDR family oxidoreductase [Ralstonia]MCO5413240.1 SDR family oxidoreductase [Ralstonia mojiangensis]MCT7297519.1 SDR family oxidoreductase [Ralstonia mojiangensis]MCT7310111.1 SDR family oxidoreductase [Ralstonia mojiangensis]
MILVTGATGFVGRALVDLLAQRKHSVRAAVRQKSSLLPDAVEQVQVERLASDSDWTSALQGVDVVIHAAARVHVMADKSEDPLAEFRCVNVQGTLALAKQAATFGVKRFVFISSVKVNGEATTPGHPFTADDAPAPLDPYGVSKAEAEQGLVELAAQTGMEIVIIRPPLVYGPGVRANFQAMMRWLGRGVPLPLGAIHNRRSLVSLDNLVDLIAVCVSHPGAANQTFLVSDGDDVSTTELLQRMGKALGRPARLVPVPASLLKLSAILVGRPGIAQRLCGSLQVDITKTREVLGWQPRETVDEGLKKAAEGYTREASV